MTHPIRIHPDLQKIRGIKLSHNPFVLALINTAMHLGAALKWSKYKNIATRHTVIGIDGARIPVWIIKPENLQAPAPALIYCHGGWFLMKHAPQHIENAVRYAREANCCVVFVDYRLAPRHVFPAGFNDCYSALMWAMQNAEKLNIDKQRVAVGGDSAGAALATSMAQKSARQGVGLCGQLLIYPVADSDCKTESSKLFVDVPPFKQEVPPLRWRAYLGHSHETGRTQQYASPIHGNLGGLAPAYIETAEFDLLRDEGLAYAKALIASGIEVLLNETKNSVHGYDLLAPDVKISDEAMANRVQFLKTIFALPRN